MKPEGQVPRTVEQMTLNNMVNIEALLDVLISSGTIKEREFYAAKQRIEKQIMDAQKGSQPAE